MRTSDAQARGLDGTPDTASAMQLSVDLAVRVVGGADAASISVVHRDGGVTVAAASDDAARRSAALQGEAGQGPCFSAVGDGGPVHVVDVERDRRWPAWARAMREGSDHRSVLVHRLFRAREQVGVLGLWSPRPGGFLRADVEHAAALAEHLAVTVRSARAVDNLLVALESRTVIGQATGILMERFGIASDQALSVLTRLSSQRNRKMRDLAAEIAATGTTAGLAPPGAGTT